MRLTTLQPVLGLMLLLSCKSESPVEPSKEPTKSFVIDSLSGHSFHPGGIVAINGRGFDATLRLYVNDRWILPDTIAPTRVAFQVPLLAGRYDIRIVQRGDTMSGESFNVLDFTKPIELLDGKYSITNWSATDGVMSHTVSNGYAFEILGDSIYGDESDDYAMIAKFRGRVDRSRSLFTWKDYQFLADGFDQGWDVRFIAATFQLVQLTASTYSATASGCFATDIGYVSSWNGWIPLGPGGNRAKNMISAGFNAPYRHNQQATMLLRRIS